MTTRTHSHRAPLAALLAALLAASGLLSACRDEKPEQLLPAAVPAQQEAALRTSDIRAGGLTVDAPVANPYEHDPTAEAEGKQLYNAMNCAGCHGPAGGGGMGPPFADADWIYGDQPENIVASILRGRPNGMPSFAGKLPEAEAWKIAIFVRSLGATARQQTSGERSGPENRQ